MKDNITYFKEPLEITDIKTGKVTGHFLGIGPAIQPDYLSKHDLFVKQNKIYILDTFKGKSKMKITAFTKRVQESIEYAIKFAEGCKKLIVPTNIKTNPDAEIPEITIYINCPDEQIDERAESLLNTIADAVKHGVRVKVNVTGNENGAWAKLLNKTPTTKINSANQR